MPLRTTFLIFLSGAVLVFAFPPFTTGYISFIGLIPLIYWLRKSSLRNAMRVGFLWGLGFHAAALYWICYSTFLGGIASVISLAFLSIFIPLIFCFGYRVWGTSFIWAFPFLWTAVEFLRSKGEIGFPWAIMAHTQTYFPAFIQYCSYAGVYAVSFWVCLLNVIILQFIETSGGIRKLVWALTGILLLILPFIHGRTVMNNYRQPDFSIRAALVQGNIDPWAKWNRAFKDFNYRTYERFSRDAAAHKPDLLIWPESAAPSFLRYDARYLVRVHRIVDSLGIPLLTGTLDAEFESGSTTRKDYNSAFFFLPNVEQFDSYAKTKLVPISERFPFKEYLPAFMRFDLGQGPSDFSTGTELTTFRIPNRFIKGKDSAASSKQEKELSGNGAAGREWNFAAIICYESVFSGLVRKYCMKPIDFLVVITNDGWFGRSSGAYQHAQFAVFRAIENRIAVARCANTGISLFINPLGQILSQTHIYEPAVLVGNIPCRQEMSFFTRHGEWFPWLVTVISGCIIIITFVQKLRKTRKIQSNIEEDDRI